MSTVQHTPGPWIWGDRYNGLYGAGPDNAVLSHDTYEGMWLAGGVLDERQHANARLIAAAPDLLEAAKALVACMDSFEASYGNMEEAFYKLAKYAAPQWEAARAAIAKAEAR